MLSRFRNPRTDLEEMGNPRGMPVRTDNWGTMASLIGPDTVGTTIVESRDLVDVTLADERAGPFTITLAGPSDGLLEPAVFPMTWGLQAEIVWGTGGAFNTARCDWIRGQVLSLFCGRLRVRAIWQSIVTNALPSAISVGAFAAHASPHGHRPAQLTTFIANLLVGPPAGFATVEVPSLARSLFLAGTPTNVPLNVDFLSPNGAVICNYVVAFYPGFTALPIPNGARWVTVTNGGQVVSNPRLIWELDL